MSTDKDILRYSKLSTNAYDITKKSPNAAGFDLYSAHNCVVKMHNKEIINTDLIIQVPNGCYGRIAPLSSIAAKSFISIGSSVIDEDYRGNVGVLIFNHSNKNFVVRKGDRIAQLICEKISNPKVVKCCADATKKLNGTPQQPQPPIQLVKPRPRPTLNLGENEFYV